MSNQTNAVGIAIILFLLFAMFTAVAIIVTTSTKESPADIQQEDGLCYIKTIQPGDTISEAGPGTYEYTLIITSRGIDVYTKCHE